MPMALTGSYPIYFLDYLATMDDIDEARERKSFDRMAAQIDRERNKEIKEFMQYTLERYCKECSMKISYIQKTYWHTWIKEQRIIQSKMDPIQLYIEIEDIIANKCDSSRYTKQSSRRRYPLTLPSFCPSNPSTKTWNIQVDVPRIALFGAFYQLASNRFEVGKAIHEILTYLEQRYELNFKDLERIYDEKQPARDAAALLAGENDLDNFD